MLANGGRGSVVSENKSKQLVFSSDVQLFTTNIIYFFLPQNILMYIQFYLLKNAYWIIVDLKVPPCC